MDKLCNSENMTNVREEDLEDFEEDMEEDSKMMIDRTNESTLDEVGNIKFIKSEIDKKNYDKIRNSIDFTKARVIRNLFERQSKDYEFAMKGMKSGRLDPTKIAEAVQGVPTVYERMVHVKTNKVTIGVLVDESGSMSGDRMDKAREAAIYINEIFKKMNDVELYIYGHTADQQGSGTVSIRVYKEKGYQTNPHALGALRARSNNRDGEAILAVANRIRGFTKDQGILFVISDGQPAAHGYGGSNGILDTREKVTKAQNIGFQVIQIAIDEDVPSKDMFDYYVKMTNIKNLPTELSNYMSTKIDKLIKETVSL